MTNDHHGGLAHAIADQLGPGAPATIRADIKKNRARTQGVFEIVVETNGHVLRVFPSIVQEYQRAFVASRRYSSTVALNHVVGSR